MSLLKAIKAQLGLSNTPANNFTITAEADNGTLKLARGDAGATTQDILTVDASGNVLVDGNNLNLFSAKSLAANGYQKLPSGLIVQWGKASSMTGGTTLTITLPLTFPTACLALMVQRNDNLSATNLGAVSAVVTSTSQITIRNGSTDTLAPMWFALGN